MPKKATKPQPSGLMVNKAIMTRQFSITPRRIHGLNLPILKFAFSIMIPIIGSLNASQKRHTTTIAEIGKGITIKTSASQRYVTDAKAIAIVKALCIDLSFGNIESLRQRGFQLQCVRSLRLQKA